LFCIVANNVVAHSAEKLLALLPTMPIIFPSCCLQRRKVLCFSALLPTISVADPHRKNADADPGKNLNADADADPDADADADSCPY
jgi:hypothetical protein